LCWCSPTVSSNFTAKKIYQKYVLSTNQNESF
jgi:hypothetical protein